MLGRHIRRRVDDQVVFKKANSDSKKKEILGTPERANQKYAWADKRLRPTKPGILKSRRGRGFSPGSRKRGRYLHGYLEGSGVER